MFNIGDRVVYPMHGAGIIEAIEEKEFLGQTERYYILRMPYGEMKVMIPVSKIDNLNIRGTIEESSVDRVLDILREEKERMNDSWNKRYRENLDKLKGGDIYQVADVLGELLYFEREKGLSTGERKMYDTAKHILVSELLLVGPAGEEELEHLLTTLSKKASS
ncbi:CarD family transcriptional regulator [Tumebacillus sp. ITR2]|uniref:CarD family transcriptional regulator n=1 Tax=Tumebacillus amylolyticus TaxID=2801339 RepID=A0ABS1JGM4_9BACL|nr:CarD family transcriptional regulator [Tumebacillus amylolyticus]MBL0389437.1 CarD family transcriptional regulator [Tumebacillus amylolyticus]